MSAPVKVTVLAARGIDTATSMPYSGTVESGDGAEMSFTVGGTINHIYVSEGQKVRKGQLLASLDGSSIDNANKIAQATLAEARDAYARLKKLHDANALPDIKWVEVQSKLKQAENAAAIAEKEVGDTKIYSPIDGVVAEKKADVGQTAIPGVPVLNIVSVSDIKVSISVAEGEIGKMTPGVKATITAPAASDMTYEGTLTQQGVVANPLSRTYDVKFKISNPDTRLLPGMLCNVTVQSPVDTASVSKHDIILPPQAILLSADNRNFVWLARNREAEQRFVTVGDITSDGIVIADGIAPGDTVIVQGMQKVSNGTKIQY